MKAVRAIGEAQVLLIDDLVNRDVLRYARKSVRVIEVGKRGGCQSTPQEFIERQMTRMALDGLTVGRLKGGDPFVFGRGGEEMLALRAHGIEVEIISGITAGIGVSASTGIPLTHRDLCHGVTFVTGHTRDGRGADWAALARSGTTLVIYMGMATLPIIVAALRSAGMAADTPAAAIQHGTTAQERKVISTLAALQRDVAAAALCSPALVVIGDVVRLASTELASESAGFSQVA